MAIVLSLTQNNLNILKSKELAPANLVSLKSLQLNNYHGWRSVGNFKIGGSRTHLLNGGKVENFS